MSISGFARKWLRLTATGGEPAPSGDGPLLSEALSVEQAADESVRDRAFVRSGPRIEPRFHFDFYWADDQNIYLRGFLFVPGQPITSFAYPCDGMRIEIPRSPRPDLAAIYGPSTDAERAGFSVMMPFRAGEPILVEVTTALGVTQLSLVLAGRSKVSNTPGTEAGSVYVRWQRRANRPGARILEIGSRAVSTISRPRVEDFPLAEQFVGVDIHPGPGVDLVCDAHTLSSVIVPGIFDYVFSLSVLEHLAMPWLIAREINRVLKVGGEVMKSVPCAFPLHETPNDFWRFTDRGLAQLFGPRHGFEIIESGMSGEVRMFPEWRDVLFEMPLNPGYAEAWIIARKVAEYDESQAAETARIAGLSRRYPYRPGAFGC